MTAISKWSYLGLTRAVGRINLKEVCRATMSGSGKKPADGQRTEDFSMAAYSSVAML